MIEFSPFLLALFYCRLGAGTPSSTGGFAFGSKYISQVAPQGSSDAPPLPTASAAIPVELDGDLAQQLQKLSKRDATTRLKALQSLGTLIPQRSSEDAAAMLPPWAYSFSRLVMDANRGVRAEACTVMGVLSIAVGRGLAPYVKSVIPSWFLARHDDSKEVAAAATASLETAFPGTKTTDALFFCRNEVSS